MDRLKLDEIQQKNDTIDNPEVFNDILPDGLSGPALIIVPAGRFRMGNSSKPSSKIEGPVHEVIVENSFALGKYPVTVNEFRHFAELTGYRTCAEVGTGGYGGRVMVNGDFVRKKDAFWDNPYFSQKGNNPVTLISWQDAAAYCEWLSKQTGHLYRLPSEAEWEYACRAGSDGDWCFGSDENLLEQYAWYGGNSDEHTHPVGEKLPNAWGLYDMHGNVQEWVADRVDSIFDGYVLGYRRRHPAAVQSGKLRLTRGGDWMSGAKKACSAYRPAAFWGSGSYNRDATSGFRVLRELTGSDKKTAIIPEQPASPEITISANAEDLALEPYKTYLLELDKNLQSISSKAALAVFLTGIVMYAYFYKPGYAVGFFFAGFFALTSFGELLAGPRAEKKLTTHIAMLDFEELKHLFEFAKTYEWKAMEAKYNLPYAINTVLAISDTNWDSAEASNVVRAAFELDDLRSKQLFTQPAFIFMGGSVLIYQASQLLNMPELMPGTLVLLAGAILYNRIVRKRRKAKLLQLIFPLIQYIAPNEKRLLLDFIYKHKWSTGSNQIRFKKMLDDS